MTETFEVTPPSAADPVTIVPDASAADPDAPYGRFANGKPRKSPPAGAGRKSSSRKSSGSGRQAPPRASAGRGKAANFTKMLHGGISMIGVAVTGLGARRRSRVVVADGMALRMAAGPLAQGINEIAQVSPRLQRILSQAGPAIPATGLALALLELTAQIAANHGRPLPGFETIAPDELVAAAEMEQMQAQQQAQAQQQQQSAEHQFADAAA